MQDGPPREHCSWGSFRGGGRPGRGVGDDRESSAEGGGGDPEGELSPDASC